LKTRKSFYRALKKVSGQFQWRLHSGGIRGYHDTLDNGPYSFCPITALAKIRTDPTGNKELHVGLTRDLGQDMGLAYGDVEDIMHAADTEFAKLNPTGKRIRRALFRATGLSS
jgi:hypothetical protein